MSAGYVLLDDATLDTVTTPDDASLDPAGTLEFTICWEQDDFAENYGPLSKFGNNAGYRILIFQDGSIQFAWGGAGSSTFKTSSGAPVSSGVPQWARCTFDGTNWSIEHSDDPADTPIGSVSWTTVGSGTEGTVTPIADAATEVVLGERDGIYFMPGKLFVVEIKDAGVVVGDPDFRDGTQTSDGGATFVDSQGLTWTLDNSATWVEDMGGGGPTALQRSIDIDYTTQTATLTESR